MSNIKYPLYNSQFGENEIKIIRQVFMSGILTHGKYVEEFEEQFASFVGCQFAIAVNSCTSALYLCLEYNKRFHYSKTITIPSATFASVANVIKHAGLNLRLADMISVGSAYYLLDDGNGDQIIDSAHQLEQDIYLQFPKSLMCFSFYPIKQLGGAEGGIIATNNGKAYNWLKKARSNGMERKGMFDWDYDVEFAGWKMNMTNVQAAILLSKLQQLNKINAYRKSIRDYYNLFFGLNNKSLHLYPVFLKHRNKFIKKMAEADIQCSVHFKPIHWQTAYKVDYSLPYSNWWGNHEVSIPFHDGLTMQDLKYITKKIEKYGNFITYHK